MNTFSSKTVNAIKQSWIEKFRGPFVITEVLNNDRYILKSIVDTSNRTLKHSYENLRAVPRGHDGLLEIASSLLNEVEAETASDVENTLCSNEDNESLDRLDTLTVCSDTASADSHTVTANSDTLSVHSDPETWEVLHEVEVHMERGNSLSYTDIVQIIFTTCTCIVPDNYEYNESYNWSILDEEVSSLLF